MRQPEEARIVYLGIGLQYVGTSSASLVRESLHLGIPRATLLLPLPQPLVYLPLVVLRGCANSSSNKFLLPFLPSCWRSKLSIQHQLPRSLCNLRPFLFSTCVFLSSLNTKQSLAQLSRLNNFSSQPPYPSCLSLFSSPQRSSVSIKFDIEYRVVQTRG